MGVSINAYLAGAGILVFAGASFFFALAETALLSLGKFQARQLSEREPGRGGLVEHLLARPQDLLATIVLGNTFAAAAMLTVAFWMAFRGDWMLVPTVAGVLVLGLIFCEVLPKTLAVRNAERWSLRVALPLWWAQQFTRPFLKLAQVWSAVMLRLFVPRNVKPAPPFTPAEYRELVEMAHQQGVLARSEKEIITQILNLNERTAKEVMKPRSQMASISDELSLEEMIAAARWFKHRRLPMYDEDEETIVGILNTRTLLLNPEADLSEAIEFPSFVPESMNLLHLMRSFQRQQRGLAIVLDEFGGVAGLVTMEDILEELVGQIRGEGESEGFVMERLGNGRWRVSGTMRLDDFRREHPQLPDVPEVETLGGLLLNLLGVVPRKGEFAMHGGVKLTAHVVDERRVLELLVESQSGKG
jgi:CBS domain containing-hemolysin-like protein